MAVENIIHRTGDGESDLYLNDVCEPAYSYLVVTTYNRDQKLAVKLRPDQVKTLADELNKWHMKVASQVPKVIERMIDSYAHTHGAAATLELLAQFKESMGGKDKR